MQRSISQIETLVARLPIAEDNAWVFEALLRLPFDVYRPVMDLLFEGAITLEDLFVSNTSDTNKTASIDDARLVKDIRTLANVGISREELLQNCSSLLAGKSVGSVVFERDTSGLVHGSASYVPGLLGLVGADITSITPTPTDLERSSSLAAAQKDLQLRFTSAKYSEIG